MTENGARTRRRSRIAAPQRSLRRAVHHPDTALGARDLLGATLSSAPPEGVAAGPIVET